jgi:hypothetical protein
MGLEKKQQNLNNFKEFCRMVTYDSVSKTRSNRDHSESKYAKGTKKLQISPPPPRILFYTNLCAHETLEGRVESSSSYPFHCFMPKAKRGHNTITASFAPGIAYQQNADKPQRPVRGEFYSIPIGSQRCIFNDLPFLPGFVDKMRNAYKLSVQKTWVKMAG